jgi:hypothetical protein
MERLFYICSEDRAIDEIAEDAPGQMLEMLEDLVSDIRWSLVLGNHGALSESVPVTRLVMRRIQSVLVDRTCFYRGS